MRRASVAGAAVMGYLIGTSPTARSTAALPMAAVFSSAIIGHRFAAATPACVAVEAAAA